MNFNIATIVILSTLLLAVGGESTLLAISFFGGFEKDIRIQKIGSLDTMTLDASRRAVIVAKNGRFCSEPAPDAIYAIAKEVAASASGKHETGGEGNDGGNKNGETKTEGKAALSQLLNSKVNKLFERSQGIQVLRDGMYRLCEAFANDAVSPAVFEEHMNYLIQTLNFIVPVELCAKLNADIVASIANAETIGTNAVATKGAKPVGDTVQEDKNRASQMDIVRILQGSEALSSNFTEKCIEHARLFASALAATADQRSYARNIAIRTAANLESAAEDDGQSVAKSVGVPSNTAVKIVNPYKTDTCPSDGKPPCQ